MDCGPICHHTRTRCSLKVREKNCRPPKESQKSRFQKRGRRKEQYVLGSYADLGFLTLEIGFRLFSIHKSHRLGKMVQNRFFSKRNDSF